MVQSMEQIKDQIKQSGAMTKGPITEDVIVEAEKKLGFKFPKSYREIIKALGVISSDSEEIFGLGVEGYLNVVETTLDERQLSNGNLNGFVVIQNLGMEGVLIVVDEKDNVYEYANGKFKNLDCSPAEYIIREILV